MRGDGVPKVLREFLERLDKKLDALKAQGKKITMATQALTEVVRGIRESISTVATDVTEVSTTLGELVTLLQAGGGTPDQAAIDQAVTDLTEAKGQLDSAAEALRSAEQAADPTP